MSDNRMGHDPLAWLMGEGTPPADASLEIAPDSDSDVEAEESPAADAGELPAIETGDSLCLEESPVVAEGVLDLGEELTVASARELHERFKAALDGDDALYIDGDRVERADGAGLQLLVALIVAAKGRQRQVEWKAASAVLHQAARVSGLQEAIHLESVQA